ncbi:MAG TPA: DUF4249 family protein [archaeon]|nr:DUF4249 family protein [archaeon]
MRRLYILILLPCLLGLMGCSKKLTFEPEHQLVVIQGYLYAGEPIKDIRLTSALELGSLDSVAPPINDAQVQLIKDGICYLLIPDRRKKGYYRYSEEDCPDCPPVDLTVETGDVFKLEVLYFGKVATAETVVPPPPGGIRTFPEILTVSNESYTGSREFRAGGVFTEDTAVAVTVSWEDDGKSLYFVSLEHKELRPSPIDPDFPFDRPGKFISAPIAGDHFPVGWSNITHYGKYLVKVYRINQEYADFYLTRNQDTRDLNEPLTNVGNGLGIFTAFNSAGIFFSVEKE